jgi:hypothetical protein
MTWLKTMICCNLETNHQFHCLKGNLNDTAKSKYRQGLRIQNFQALRNTKATRMRTFINQREFLRVGQGLTLVFQGNQNLSSPLSISRLKAKIMLQLTGTSAAQFVCLIKKIRRWFTSLPQITWSRLIQSSKTTTWIHSYISRRSSLHKMSS